MWAPSRCTMWQACGGQGTKLERVHAVHAALVALLACRSCCERARRPQALHCPPMWHPCPPPPAPAVLAVGMLVTDSLGAVTRTVLETLRTLFVWLLDLLL